MDTSIDPSEDGAQLRLLLNSIADALRQKPGTSVNFDESNDIEHLTLHTSTSLPHPLQPLEWSIVLVLAPNPAFASEFISPLLSQQLTAKVEKTSLLQHLKEKDDVISKLIDKVQGDGVDLGKLFPGAVSSKPGTGPASRAAVAKSIKGLREFDQDQWKRRLASENSISGDVGSLLPKIFNDDGEDSGEAPQVIDYGEWWKNVHRKDSPSERATPAFSRADTRQESVIDDDFQRQPTPTKSSAQTLRREGLKTDPEAKALGTPRKGNPDEGGSTTDESDEDSQSSHFKPLPTRTDNALGDNPADDTKGIQSEPMDLDDDGLTASASDIDRSPATTHLVPKPKQKLGKIGGKRKDSSPEPSAIPYSKPKLGKIGGKDKLGKPGGIGSVSSQNKGTALSKQEDSVSPKREARDSITAPKSVESERRGRTFEQPPEPSPPRETSQERANRKRDQLKRELENKSQAAFKKKRKF